MPANSTRPLHPLLFFISKFLVLAGMVLVFSIISLAVGLLAAYLIFGVNLATEMSVMTATGIYTDNMKNGLMLMQSLASIGGFIIPAWFFSKAINRDPRETLMIGRSFSPWLLLAGIALYFAAVPFNSWLAQVNEQIKLPAFLANLENQLKAAEESARRLTAIFTDASSFSQLVMNIFVVAVIPAVCEELLFRGALMKFLSICFRNKHAAVIFTALLFSLFHMQFYGFLPRFALGIILGYIVVGTGSIWPAIVVHFINNALVALATYYKWDVTGPEMVRSDHVFPMYINIISLVVSAGLMYVLIREWHKRKYPNGE